MKLTTDSQLFKEKFGPYPSLAEQSLARFESQGPTFGAIKNAFLDDSTAKLYSDPESLNGIQSQDVRNGLRLFMRDLSVGLETDAGQPEISINCPTSLLVNGLQQVVSSAEIGSVLSNQTVFTIFNGVVSGDPKKVGVALVGVGMAAVGVSVPVVGWIGAAITIIASAVSAAFNRAKAKKVANDAERARQLYAEFPPMQVADADMDGATVERGVRPLIRKHDWTEIWAPAFKGEWQGVNRQGGMAFAQGGADSGDDDITHEATRFFVPSDGLGVIPGTDQVTRVVQVSLETNPDDLDAAAWLAFKKGGKDPRGIDINGRKGYTRVKDTGMYYPATGRLAASLWEMLTSKEGYGYHGNPYVFRVDARRLHDAWREWAEGGLRYIREVCYPWYPKYLQPDGTIAAALNLDGPDPAADLAGYFGTGIFLAMGVWAGRVAPGSTSYVQKYTIYPQPAGFSGAELRTTYGAYGMENSSVSSSYSGAFLPIYDPAKWPDQCMGERYHRGPLGISIAGTLADLQKLQAWTLRHTLASAYCSQFDAAFAGNANAASRANLLKMRSALLKATDRMYINLNDVPDDEPGISGMPRSESWKQQLVAAGVPATPKKVDNSVKLSAGQRPPGQGLGGGIPCEVGIPCPDKPPPKPAFVAGNPDPWEPKPPKRVGRPDLVSTSIRTRAIAAATVSSVGTALAAALVAHNRRRRNFVAGGT
ncbi:MAG: hypothetical protein KA756_11530 [Steroidobacteraceae bacterium]|nr:hypothetical protein [Steroidobacteraceae bacterium]